MTHGETGDIHATQYGETPIDEDAREYLTTRYSGIRTKDELNQAESENIAMALDWLEDHPFETSGELLDQYSLRDLHRRMFEHVWIWAGKLRLRETNMGVDPHRIAEQWEDLLRNVRTQIEFGSVPTEQIGLRLHRRMLAIHCFPNGNGRHARLVANELARVLGLGEDFYTWGQATRSGDPEGVRQQYLAALRLADTADDYGPLLDIAIS
jgi:Fic-DOC domain mobile mystery protein B